MASPNPEPDSSSMFMNKIAAERAGSPTKPGSQPRRNSVKNPPAEITIKDFFDFMRIAYQVYEHLEGGDDSDGGKIDWEQLTKLTVVNQAQEQQDRELLKQTAFAEHRPHISKSDNTFDHVGSGGGVDSRRGSVYRRRSLRRDARVEMYDVWSEANLKCKLNDVINEGIMDSILPYIVGYKKPNKTTSCHQPIIKKTPPSASTTAVAAELKKPSSFGGLVDERPSRDRLGRRKSSLAADKSNQKQEGDVEIHVCDEVKGMKKDFRCPQKLLVSKMGYFADVTSGQKLEDMDISVHCDIQIFDWLMRWVKRDTILVADWPLLDPSNVIPILVSASFLQMDPLLHDCLIYCHAHMNEIVKTSTNLACLSDTLLTRLAAMYTNTELEAVRDRKDKIHSRLYCKMILSLAEPVPETLRGHYATLATLFKCNRCNKLLGRNVAENVPCQPANMRIDQRGYVLSTHNKDASWNLSDYIVWLHGELRSWRRVYWRLWGDCHFLKCLACDCYFPAYQMEWCCHHAEGAQFFTLDGRPPLPLGRYPCCGERAYRFELVTRNTGCQFREHTPDECGARDAIVMSIYRQFRETIAMRPPQLMFPERLTRLVAREPGDDSGRLQGKEVFWWEGIQLAPPRQPLGLLGKLYTGNTKFNQNMSHAGRVTAGTASAHISSALATAGPVASVSGLAGVASLTCNAAVSPEHRNMGVLRLSNAHNAPITTVIQETEPTREPEKKGITPSVGAGACVGGTPAAAEGSSSDGDSSDTSEDSSDSNESAASEEDKSARTRRAPPPPSARKRTTSPNKRRVRGGGRQWVASLSARSNQDGQRRFEERALRQMKLALVRRGPVAAPTPATHRHRAPPGGVYVKLEAEWREVHCPQQTVRTRPVYSARHTRNKVYK